MIANVPAKPGPQTQPLGLKSKPENIAITFDCTRCEASFSKQFQLKRHALEAHQETASFSTVDQGYFVRPEEIVIANVVEPDSLQTILVQADLEPMESLQPWNQQQQQRQTKRVLGCPLDPCDFKSPFKSKVKQHLLEAHVKRHQGQCEPGKVMHVKGNSVFADYITPDDGRELFKCDQCDCIYPYKQSLTQHIIRVHGNGSMFVCEVCGKSFTQKHRFTVHKASAHGQFKLMPNLCTVCGRRFVTPFSLHLHMAERHNKSLVPQEN